MSQAFFARLPDRGVLRVGGPDAARFLQDLVTNDMDVVARDGAGYGALLTPQGKILFDFIIIADGESFLFDVSRASAAGLARRLGFYRLRAKVEIKDVSDEMEVGAAWGGAKPAVEGRVVADPRLPALGCRLAAKRGLADPAHFAVASAEDYRRHRIAKGVPESGVDFALGDAFPHDADLDQLNGVGFKKGCYVGQEVVSRMEHRGTARKRIAMVQGLGPLPGPGAAITVDGRPVGTLGSSAGNNGLAMVRIDKVADARLRGISIMAGEVPVEISLPAFARFGWPVETAGE